MGRGSACSRDFIKVPLRMEVIAAGQFSDSNYTGFPDPRKTETRIILVTVIVSRGTVTPLATERRVEHVRSRNTAQYSVREEDF